MYDLTKHLKVGDTVYSLLRGEGKVDAIRTDNRDYAIKVTYKHSVLNYCSYTKEGFYSIGDKCPEITLSPVTVEIPPEPEIEPDWNKEFYDGREVWVKDKGLNRWLPRIACVYLPSSSHRFVAYSIGEGRETSKEVASWEQCSLEYPYKD